MLWALAIYFPSWGIERKNAGCDDDCHGEDAENPVDQLIPAPFVLHITIQIDLNEADEGPGKHHHQTVSFVILRVILGDIYIFASALWRDQLLELFVVIIVVSKIVVFSAPSCDQRKLDIKLDNVRIWDISDVAFKRSCCHENVIVTINGLRCTVAGL